MGGQKLTKFGMDVMPLVTNENSQSLISYSG
jgi:hypothetical protein